MSERPLTTRVPDRQLLVAIFNAICGLAEKLTGERMAVIVPTSDGDLPYYGLPVAWTPTHQSRGVEVHDVPRQPERSSTRHEPLQEPNDIQQEHC
jgi:hypothetical protein